MLYSLSVLVTLVLFGLGRLTPFPERMSPLGLLLTKDYSEYWLSVPCMGSLIRVRGCEVTCMVGPRLMVKAEHGRLVGRRFALHGRRSQRSCGENVSRKH